MSNVLALSPRSQTTGYLALIAGVGAATTTFLALFLNKPSNLGQNDLQEDWKKLSVVSALGSLVSLHYGVTGQNFISALYSTGCNLGKKE